VPKVLPLMHGCDEEEVTDRSLPYDEKSFWLLSTSALSIVK
jgi:hypothetical protein